MRKANRTIVVLPDIHAPLEDKKAFNCALKVIKEVSPSAVIQIGDIGEWESVSKWRWKKQRRPPLEYQLPSVDKEINAVRNVMRKINDNFAGELIVIKGNHDCHDEKTQALTNNGWKYVDDISNEDEIFSIDTDTGNGVWSKPLAIVDNNYEGEMISSSGHIDMKITSGHRLIGKRRNSESLEYWTFDDAPERIKLITGVSSTNCDIELSDDELSLAGWILTDGGISNNRVTIYQSKDTTEIVRVLGSLNLNYRLVSRNRTTSEICGVPLVKPPMTSYEFHLDKDSSYRAIEVVEKKGVMPSWANRLSDRQFDIFLNSIVLGDGTWFNDRCKENTCCVVHGTKDFLDDLQRIAVQHGWRTKLSIAREKDYRLNLTKRTEFQIEKSSFKKEQYSGRVWCLNTKHGNFMVRRDGVAHFSGNCWLDNFIEENPFLAEKYSFDNVYEYECSKIVPCGEFHKEGDLYLYHGHHYQGLLHTRSHLLSMGENVMYGHWHDVQQYTLTRVGGTISAWSIGCLKDMSKHANKWLGGQQVNWKHALAIVEFYGSKFFVRIVEIVDGKCSLDGKLLEG